MATLDATEDNFLMILRDGLHLATRPGARSAAALDELIGKVRQIDMDEVRRELDAAADEAEVPQAGAA